MPSNVISVSVALRPDQVEKLRKLSAKEGRSTSAYLRRLIDRIKVKEEETK